MEIMQKIEEEFKISAVLNDVKIIDGFPYFTKSGLKKVATAQHVKIIMPTVKDFNHKEGWAEAECIITCADDSVCKGSGWCDRDEPGRAMIPFHNIRAIACTRATRRALVLATAVPNCPYEDLPDDMKDQAIDATFEDETDV